jgi:hypothetical protein
LGQESAAAVTEALDAIGLLTAVAGRGGRILAAHVFGEKLTHQLAVRSFVYGNAT